MPVQDRHKSYIADQRKFFDELIVDDWGTYINSRTLYGWEFEVNELFRRIPVPATVINLGSGSGYHDVCMARFNQVRKIVSIDYSKKSMRRAHTVFPHPKVNRIVMDLFHIGVKERFDLTVNFQVLEHLRDPAIFLRQCVESARSGGHVAIFTPNRLRFANRLRSLKGLGPSWEDPMHFREYSAQEIRMMGEGVGLRFHSSFAYYMDHRSFKSLPYSLQIHSGRVLPWLASRIGVIFEVIT